MMRYISFHLCVSSHWYNYLQAVVHEVENISSLLVLQYESSSCFADGLDKYRECYKSYMKIDVGSKGVHS